MYKLKTTLNFSQSKNMYNKSFNALKQFKLNSLFNFFNKKYNTLDQIEKEIKNEGNPNVNKIFASDTFTKRHIGPYNEEHTKEMLSNMGYSKIEELIKDVIPSQIMLSEKQLKSAEDTLGYSLSEKTALEYIGKVADENKLFQNYIGLGYHPTVVPPVILRNVTENPGWYTSYTPYQAEISQGRLEVLLNFQNMICELTGLPWANASLLDEATAAAEAMYLSVNAHFGRRNEFFIYNETFDYVKEVVKTRASMIGIKIVEGSLEDLEKSVSEGKLCGALIQNPDNKGKVKDHGNLVKKLKENKVVSIMSADILSLMLLKSGGEYGFDVVVGSAQRFGVPMMNGGPHAGFLAVKDEFKRKMPGRLVAISKDSNGDMAIRLALQTREQHIKREKATSNICTAQALLANMSTLYAIWHGKQGLENIASKVHGLAVISQIHLEKLGIKFVNKTSEVFDTIVIDSKSSGFSSKDLLEFFYNNKINLRDFKDNNLIGLSFNETTSVTDVERLFNLFEAFTKKKLDKVDFKNIGTYDQTISKNLLRDRNFLNLDIFNKPGSETKFMRFLYVLQKKDYSLIDGMIPLGSCTMKLNAAAELIPITNPNFSNIHPFSPENQRQGYKKLIDSLIEKLKVVTQFEAVSLQPNSGANGEFAGIMAIKRYQESIGQGHRNIVFIPASSHGTNPASAAICGLKVVVINSDKQGNVDIKDLKVKLEKHGKELSCIMITYPSTHGVFEEDILEITEMVHKIGGQVYIDGANMNAHSLWTSPFNVGGDVCHLNLHKTFAIPHGGGGPGVGPICGRKHLEPFMPGHHEFDQSKQSFSVTSAPYGSAGILPISFMYIKMLGRDLKQVTEYSILNANYMASRLKGHYDLLFANKNGRWGHEFIIDIRPIKAKCGITEEDVCKRMMDYGFHGPTMSFPVAGALMCEPTESEDKGELDRFVDALISIRQEIKEVEEGKVDKNNNVLKHAPHTLGVITTDKWDRPYSREKAAFPAPNQRAKGKFWPAVGRIDNVYGDLNLSCSCPPIHYYL